MPAFDTPTVGQLEEMRSRYLNKLVRFDRNNYNDRRVGIITAIVPYGEKYPSLRNRPDPVDVRLTFDLNRAGDHDEPVRNYWLRPELIEVWGES